MSDHETREWEADEDRRSAPVSDETEAVEALARALHSAHFGGLVRWADCSQGERLWWLTEAELFLASDWLAQRDAALGGVKWQEIDRQRALWETQLTAARAEAARSVAARVEAVLDRYLPPGRMGREIRAALTPSDEASGGLSTTGGESNV